MKSVLKSEFVNRLFEYSKNLLKKSPAGFIKGVKIFRRKPECHCPGIFYMRKHIN